MSQYVRYVPLSVSGGGPSNPLTIGNFGSSPNAAGGVISGTVLTLEPASASFPGGVSTATQSFAGAKTFTSPITAAAGSIITGSLPSAYVGLNINNTSGTSPFTQLNFNNGTGTIQSAVISYAPGIFFLLGPVANDTTTPLQLVTNNSTVGLSISPASVVSIPNLTGGQVVASSSGALSVEPNVVYADTYAGGDLGAKINAADAALGSTAGTIMVPSGNYTITTQIVLSHANRILQLGVGTYTLNASSVNGSNALIINADNVTVQGAGMYQTILMQATGLTNGDDVIRAVGGAFYKAYTTNPTTVVNSPTVRNLTINGNSANVTPHPDDTYGNGINFNKVNSALIENCFVELVLAQGIAMANGDNQAHITENNIIRNNIVTTTGEVGIGLEAYYNNCEIVDNIIHDMTVNATFPNSCVGIVIGGLGNTQDSIQQILVSRNQVYNIPGAGMTIQDSSCYITVSDNIFSNCATATTTTSTVLTETQNTTYANKLIFANNQILLHPGKDSFALQIQGLTTGFGFIQIIGNKIDKSQGGGMLIGSSEGCHVVGNQITNVGLGAGTYQDAILLASCTTAFISGNYCHAAAGYGINILGSASTNTIDTNYLVGNTSGAYTDAGTGTVQINNYDGTSLFTSKTVNLTSLTASRLVVTDASKNLASQAAGNLTDAGTDGIVVTGGTGALVTSASIAQHVADTTHNGYLSSTDWNTFNGKGSGTVTAVSVASANGFAGSSSGGATPALTISTSINAPVLAGNGTAIAAATTTGSGSTVVLATSPTLVTPALGTPSALVGTNITGTASGLTAGNVTTNANLTGVITSVGNATSIASQTGTGTKFVVDTSPTLVTPVLGVASATTINKVTLTAPATGSTLTIADGKTLTVSNTMTLTATDGSTLAIGGGGTLGSNAYTSTAYAPLASPTFTGAVTIPTPFTIGAVSMTSTGTQLNYLNAATGVTGSGSVVLSAAPALTGAVTASGTIAVGGGAVSGGSIASFSSSNAAAYNSIEIDNTSSTGFAKVTFSIGSSGGSGLATVKYAPGLFFQMGPESNDTTSPMKFVTNNNTVGLQISTGSVVSIPVNTAATSTGTGSLTVAGGVGIAGAAYVGGNLVTQAAISWTGYDTSTATSGTITASANKPGLIITGAGGTTLTIKLPSSPIDGQQYFVGSQGAFTTITWQDSGGTAGNVIGGQAAIGGATRGQTFLYSSAATKWFSIS